MTCEWEGGRGVGPTSMGKGRGDCGVGCMGKERRGHGDSGDWGCMGKGRVGPQGENCQQLLCNLFFFKHVPVRVIHGSGPVLGQKQSGSISIQQFDFFDPTCNQASTRRGLPGYGSRPVRVGSLFTRASSQLNRPD